MKIAVVTSQFPVPGEPTRGRPILQTVQALARHAEVAVFVPNARYPRWLEPRSYNYVAPGALRKEGERFATHDLVYPTWPLLGRATNGIAVARCLAGPVREFAPDVILSYWLYPDAFGAARVAQQLGVPLVAGARGSDLRARDRLTLGLTRRAVSRAAALLCVSEDLRRIAVERFGVQYGITHVIPNGCDTTLFHLGSRVDARAALGVSRNVRLILYVGRLVAAKGLRELFDAWLTLAGSDDALQLAFIGEGSLRDLLQQRAERSGLASRVHLPGAAPAERVAEWMRAADVFCLPSYTEGYPNVLVEALACGRPVVSTPVGGIVEIVDKDNGVLVPPRDSAALADGLRAALSRTWNETQLSAKFARSWDAVAEETLRVCRQAAQERPQF